MNQVHTMFKNVYIKVTVDIDSKFWTLKIFSKIKRKMFKLQDTYWKYSFDDIVAV